MKKSPTKRNTAKLQSGYTGLINGIGELLESSRHATARVVNSFMTATYWELGRRIVEFEQGGKKRAEYGEELLKRLAEDLTTKFGKGFSRQNLQNMRLFFDKFPPSWIRQTLSGKSGQGISQTPSGISGLEYNADHSLETLHSTNDLPAQKFTLQALSSALPLPWSHYVQLVKHSRSLEALSFYHREALLGGWSVRQLERQISSLFYERTALSKDKAAMLKKGSKAEPGDALTAAEAIRDPLVLEFLNLKDEYSETELEEALIRHLESFLLELGSDFAFVGRQRRLRIDDEWYRVDLLFFHRRLRCLVIVDLKLGKFSHADAGQMHLYLNYAREHWTHPDENPPVGIILCSSAGQNIVRYTLDNLPNQILAKEYRLALPEEKRLAQEMQRARNHIESHKT